MVLHAGNRAWLPQLIENPSFRTNIALTNTGSMPSTVRVTLSDGYGSVIGSYDVDLEAGEWAQQNRPYERLFGVTDLAAGSARIQVISGSGILAYASVVDNVTNDPTTIPVATP